MLADLLFLLFSSVLLIAALGVITAKNPMHCVLFMILSFFNAAGLFILLGAEFLGLLLVMVYVGAIAVMFLFIVMTIDIDFAVLKGKNTNIVPMGILVSAVLLLELIAGAWGGMFHTPQQQTKPVMQEENAQILGEVLFTDYVVPFQGAAIILLIAMVGAIVLTHRRRSGVKRQDITKQIQRKKSDCMIVTEPPAKSGVAAAYFVGKGVEK
ncbi:MAG: NADH-quinone oxidoreductase subunit J [Alphaproteobacteria bacterium]|nr:NADH-quinone oxidoreductase subunit J [Alphaproteobacteria bacterium]MDD9919746.1 NADH-quinone oxidoreductase subunit J [Alphaproteobacteria bacterium]